MKLITLGSLGALSVVVRLEGASKPPGELGKAQIAVSDLVSDLMGLNKRTCISNKFTGDAHVLVLVPHFEPLQPTGL